MSKFFTRVTATAVAALALALVASDASSAQTPGADGTDTGTNNSQIARRCPLPDEAPAVDPNDPLFTGSDGKRDIRFFAAFRMAEFPCEYPRDFRSIIMFPDALVLVNAGRVERAVPFATGGKPVTFDTVAQAIGDPAWIAQDAANGRYTIDAAFIQQPGTSLVVSAPEVKEIRLTTRTNVFMGGRNSTVLFNGTKVTSWDVARQGPDVFTDDGRPFVIYAAGSKMDIVDSTFSYLGSDRSGGSYGVAWQNGGSTGSAINSVFENNFFGAYTAEAKNVVFRKNKFRNNIVYGLDPHDFSTGLVIEDNEATGNGKHGIILSNYCSDSVVRNNRVSGNGANGIVLDKVSSNNRIENNIVENNKGDGIVTIDAPSNVITKNTITSNRVGIRIDLPRSYDNRIGDNTIKGNVSGIRLEGGAHDVLLSNNTVTGSSEAAVTIDAPRTMIDGLTIEGGKTGMLLRTLATVKNTNIRGVALGMAIESQAIPQLDQVNIESTRDGIRVDNQVALNLDNTTVNAPNITTVRGVTRDWRRWLPVGGLALIVLAYLIELLRRGIVRRHSHDSPLREAPTIPNIVLNPT